MSLTQEQFLKDVEDHKMTILQDDGVRRHLRFGQPECRNGQFEIVTWGGHLCYTGDMGTYVFSRLYDMFNFFRGDNINPQYWAEKVLAVDSWDGLEEYSPQVFEGHIKFAMAEGWDFNDWEGFRKAVKDEVLSHSEDGEQAALRAACDFMYEGIYPFQDFWEVNVKEYTTRYIWCCYAIVWAIKHYDKHIAEKEKNMESENV